MSTELVEQHPEGEKVDDEKKDEQEPVNEDFKFYLRPEVTYKIVSTKWLTFTALGGFCYCYHFVWTVAGVDNYCDTTRTYRCIPEATNDDEASAIYDLGIALVSIFHMIEWLRQTVFLTTALVNVNLMPLYYFLSINVPFGFVAMIIGLGFRFGDKGSRCAENALEDQAQAERSAYLRDQIFALVLYIPMCFAHIIFFYVKGKEWCHEQYLAEDEDEDD